MINSFLCKCSNWDLGCNFSATLVCKGVDMIQILQPGKIDALQLQKNPIKNK